MKVIQFARPASIFLLLLICTALYSEQIHPPVKWKFQAKDAIISSPVIDEDIVYFSSLDQNLYAISLQSGVELWKFSTGSPNRSTVLVSGANLYLLSGDGTLFCLDKKTSKIIWRFTTRGEKKYPLFSFADHFQSSPVIDHDAVYFGCGDSIIYALNAKTGNLIWKFKTGDVVHTSPVVKGEKLMIGSFDGYFYALNKINGKLIWKFKSVGQRYFPKGEFSGSPAVSGNTVYVGSRDFNFYAINIDRGVCNWNRYFSYGWAIATPVFYKNMVIAGTSDDKILAAMDTTTGTISWKAPAGFNIFGSCMISDSTGFFGTLNGKLFSLNLNNGNLLWSFTTDGYNKYHDDYLTGDEQYNDSSLSMLSKDLATQVGIFFKLGGIFSRPVLKDGLLIVTSSEGMVYCLDLGKTL